jgi:hypothetical protein
MQASALHTTLRPFGSAADLDLDFANPDRPFLVTGLLAQCAEHGDPELWWSQPVGIRTAALLHLVGITDASARELSFSARCGQGSCGEPFEFALPLGALLESRQDDALIEAPLEGDRHVKLRRPTGNDLRRWRTMQPGSTDQTVRTMLDSLLLEGEARAEDVPELSRALAERDPLVALSLSCFCPGCGAGNEISIDLEAVALARLERCRRCLLHEIHALASRYGWTEAEILALPPARRAHYLALIEGES